MNVKNIVKNKMAGQAAIYFLANILNAGLGFFLLPIFSHFLTPAQYGLWAIWGTCKSLVECTTRVGQTSLTAKYVHKEDRDVFRDRLFISFTIISFFNVILLLGISISSVFTDILFGIDIKYYFIIPFVAVIANTLSINANLLRHEGAPWQFFSFQMTNSVMTPLLSLVFIYFLQLGWIGFLAGSVITSIFLWFCAVIRLCKKYHLALNWKFPYFKEQIRLGAPLILHGLTVMILSASDRLILAELVDETAVGIYAINYKVGMTIQLVTLAFASTLVPWIYSQLKKPTRRNKLNIVYMNFAYGVGMIILAIGISLCGPYLVKLLFNSQYHFYQEVIAWAAFGGLAHSLYSLFISTLIYFERTKVVMWASVTVAIINIILTILFVLNIGVVGAAIASFISYVIFFLIVSYNTQKVFPLPWRHGIKRLFLSEQK